MRVVEMMILVLIPFCVQKTNPAQPENPPPPPCKPGRATDRIGKYPPKSAPTSAPETWMS